MQRKRSPLYVTGALDKQAFYKIMYTNGNVNRNSLQTPNAYLTFNKTSCICLRTL